MKFHYQKNYVDCDCMTKHDETGLQFGKGSAWTGTGDQREQTEDFAAIQVVQPKEKKKKEAVWSWVGGSQEYISTKVPISLIHTHTQPASVSAETKDTNTDDRMHAPHSRSKSLVRNTTRPKVLTASLTGGQ